MKWIFALSLIGCTSSGQRPSLEGPFECGPHTCNSGEICITESAGSQCWVNEDAGIGQYQTVSWDCVELPKDCDGIPSCDCTGGGGICLGVSAGGREVDFGCI